jgi:segregation and condensation protein B
MSEHALTNVLEAILLAAGRPLTIAQISELFQEPERPTDVDLREALADLARRYAGRGIELVEVASGWRIQVRPVYSPVVSRLWQERPTRYSRALLETLALVAYRQPVTRGEIEAIRGVTVASTIMRTLFERNWIRVVGHREVPGRPELLGTTREFLDYFGLRRLDELPTLAELRDLDDLSVQLQLEQDGDDSVVALPVVSVGSGTVPDETSDDEIAADHAEQERTSEANTPTLVARGATLIDS